MYLMQKLSIPTPVSLFKPYEPAFRNFRHHLGQHDLVGACSSMLSEGKAQDQTGRAFDAFTAP
jgi:hypothetical protein